MSGNNAECGSSAPYEEYIAEIVPVGNHIKNLLLENGFKYAETIFRHCVSENAISVIDDVFDFYESHHLLTDLLRASIESELAKVCGMDVATHWCSPSVDSLFRRYLSKICSDDTVKVCVQLVLRATVPSLPPRAELTTEQFLGLLWSETLTHFSQNLKLFPSELKATLEILRAALDAQHCSNASYAVSTVLINFALKPAVIDYISMECGAEDNECARLLLEVKKPDHMNNIALQCPEVHRQLACISQEIDRKFLKKLEAKQKTSEGLALKVVQFCRDHGLTTHERIESRTLDTSSQASCSSSGIRCDVSSSPETTPNIKAGRDLSTPSWPPNKSTNARRIPVAPLDIAGLRRQEKYSPSDDEEPEEEGQRFSGILYSPSSNRGDSSDMPPAPFSARRSMTPPPFCDSPRGSKAASPKSESPRVSLVSLIRHSGTIAITRESCSPRSRQK